jgi:ketopantoate reductase
MQMLIVGIGALGGTIAARAIRTGHDVRPGIRSVGTYEHHNYRPWYTKSNVEFSSRHESG